MKAFRCAFFAGIASLTAMTAASAKNFPSRNVEIVVPYAAGSGTDLLARLLAEQLGRKWDKGVIVENVAGAGGNIGATRVARASADGHTLMLCPPGPLSTNKLLYKSLQYDPEKWQPIAVLATVPYILLARSSLPAKDFRGFLKLTKDSAAPLSAAAPGVGSTAQLSTLLLSKMANIPINVVPYSGLGTALNDVVSGHVDIMFDTISTSLPLHKDGSARILAVGSEKRLETLPDVPTIAEEGLSGFRSITWFGLVAPPNTPADIAQKISADVQEIMKSPSMQSRLNVMNMTPTAITGDDAKRYFETEMELWRGIIQSFNITVQ